MAQSGYTPIQLYHSATASAAPTAGNLADGELAINTNDGVLYYKDSGGVVRTLASKNAAAGVFTSITDSALTSGRVTYAGTGGLLQDSANLTFNGTTLTATGFAGALNGTVGATTPSTGVFTTLGVGATPSAGQTLVNGAQITGATASYANVTNGTVQSGVTDSAHGYATSISTAASAFTLNQLIHFRAIQGTKGAGSVVNIQQGFYVNSNLTGATNNYGFFGNLAAGTGRYNLYMAGTADNYLAGSLGIGTASLSGSILSLGTSLTGTTAANAVTYKGQINSDASIYATIYSSSPSIQASAALTNVYHFDANQGTKGAGASITTQFGFTAESSLTGATNNYGFYGGIASGTGRYNLYMAGTADNWFSGNVLIGGAGGLGYTTGSGGAITQTVSRTSGVTLNKTNGAITLVSAAGSATYQSFTVTNSTVAATDTIIINQKSGTDLYEISITAVAAGSFRVTYRTTGGTTTEQPVFNFSVIKAVTA